MKGDRDWLLSMFEESPVHMVVLEGAELRIALMNRIARETWGPAVMGKTMREIYATGSPILPLIERAYATGVAETVHGSPPFLADGTHADRFFTRSYVPLRDGRGAVAAILIV